MKNGKAISADEKRWRAESDAESLIRAYEVESDKARHKLAIEEMKKEINDKEKKLNIQKKLIKK